MFSNAIKIRNNLLQFNEAPYPKERIYPLYYTVEGTKKLPPRFSETEKQKKKSVKQYLHKKCIVSAEYKYITTDFYVCLKGLNTKGLKLFLLPSLFLLVTVTDVVVVLKRSYNYYLFLGAHFHYYAHTTVKIQTMLFLYLLNSSLNCHCLLASYYYFIFFYLRKKDFHV